MSLYIYIFTERSGLVQKKFTIKKNAVKVIKKGKDSQDTSSSNITRRYLSEDIHINIITSSDFDKSNLSRLKTPIEAEKSGFTGSSPVKRKRAKRDFSLKAAPPVPTAPKDRATIRKQWLMHEFRSVISSLDVVLIISTLVLAVFGLLAIHSATLTFETNRFLIVQGAAIIVGIIVAAVISVFDYRELTSHYKYIIAANAFLLLITFIFGSSVTSATNANWIDLGIIKIQPSEFAKLLFILGLAMHLASVRDKMHKLSTVASLVIHAVLIFGLVLLQKDLGSLTIFLVIFVCMSFAASLDIRYYIAGFFGLLCASPFLWARLSEYQKNRILLCFDPSIDPLGNNIRYQQLRSQTAIGNGRIFGTGYCDGSVTQAASDTLPAKHTDMIFSTICEEFGIIGAAIVLGLTVFFVLRIIKIALDTSNTAGRYICVGVASMFMIQIVENVGMCLGVMPVIGITYPFLSYGGSSVLSCFIAVGMVLSVCTHRDKTFFD